MFLCKFLSLCQPGKHHMDKSIIPVLKAFILGNYPMDD